MYLTVKVTNGKVGTPALYILNLLYLYDKEAKTRVLKKQKYNKNM